MDSRRNSYFSILIEHSTSMPNSMIAFTNSEAEITICIARDFIAHFWPAFAY